MYGFGLRASEPLPGLVEVEPDAPVAAISWRQAPVPENRLQAGEGSLQLSVRDTALIEVSRSPRQVKVALPEPPRPEAIVHPVATTALAVLARWLGRPTLHAGAVLHEGAAYAICGEQGAGKSSTLALLARAGHRIVADDLLVLDEGDVHAGPSCIDLRADVAARFPEATPLGVIGARERFRLATVPSPPRVPLGGVFLLDWSEADTDTVEAVPLGAAERAALVHRLDYAGFMGPAEPGAMLELIGLPMWRIRRPRRWEDAERFLEALLEVPASYAGARSPPRSALS